MIGRPPSKTDVQVDGFPFLIPYRSSTHQRDFGMNQRIIGLFVVGWLLTTGAAFAGLITVNGNGAAGFGGTVGLGSLTLSDDGTTLSGSFSRGSSILNNALVLYFDTRTGGFSDTASFTDVGDGLRRAITGREFNNDSNQSLVTFAPGFLADYAIAFDAGFGGLWELAGGGSHTYIDSVALTPTGNAASATHQFSISLAQLSVPAGGQIRFVGTYISTTGFRSNEAFGNIGSIENPGFGGPITFTNSFSFTAVPEPSAMIYGTALCVGLIGLRRRRASDNCSPVVG